MIPGAWHGGWSWVPVAQRLRAAGHRAITVTLPGRADGDDPRGHRLADAADHLRLVESRDLTDVVLAGHSWAGYPITGAAGRLTGIVHYGAQVPIAGRSMIDDNPSEAAALLSGLIDASPTRSIAPALPRPGATFAERLGVPVVSVPGTHPDEIAMAILAAPAETAPVSTSSGSVTR